ncbi:NAD(P)-dependent dehydrogenase (short-subunit alcohol dehydrogenase family) [Mycolicibacterium sp. BK556]|uniref:SDR family NAD(P)-dependent oxidoreductase n=1 Tax=Mycobacteriaceae TaxID=1762 RepID=UPI00105BC301|nr:MULTISPECIES: SDR family NAD(P)-dependent oxidoreductase [Mycobacteriaceae]MBB3600649.1 NAD(P)-dependent dehydrogenase (short-subunit alcohol dehydrogenase family) [Mycolicibacterium sp. BK556]MBB3630402.1 NAD(P)-dependent dehydrogenase (short-subunit alcohol dehydrogenase family) [Mycolicibacterium sp. BK607]MBB3748401.1 NAD(P)-dependent dehydrogenase (short-subunit alcohol dehydrogenase family) [Mycolicibacterium sp. BK634]TDO10189.1 NAD(P)-dependent dehydrogenase (short-subunit alcohol de
MNIDGASAVVTGGASGLGLATVKRLLDHGAHVVIVDLPTSAGESVAAELGPRARFSPADVRSTDEVTAALDLAAEAGPVRAVVHCAGRGGPVRVVDKNGEPGSLELYTEIVTTNLIGSFNVLRLAAARMAGNEPLDGDRGVVIMTASVAAFEGQIGQIPYASSKAGVVGMTIVAARDLAGKQIRVNTIAPGTFDTPLLARLSEPVRNSLAATVPHPSRLGDPGEFAHLALAIIENGMLNGETIRLDGAIRMAPR